MAQGVGGERGALEVKRGFGLGKAWHGAGSGKHPWLHHPSRVGGAAGTADGTSRGGEAGRKQADGESDLF